MLHHQCFPFYLSLREYVCSENSRGLSIQECVGFFPMESSSCGLWWFFHRIILSSNVAYFSYPPQEETKSTSGII
ncbi:hypothetical protein Bca4012_011532 [Brassica carinata]